MLSRGLDGVRLYVGGIFADFSRLESNAPCKRGGGGGGVALPSDKCIIKDKNDKIVYPLSFQQ